MNNKIKVNYKNILVKEYPINTTLLEISKSFASYYNFPIIIGKVDNDLMDLTEEIKQDCEVDFYDRSSEIGNTIYSRGVYFILAVAVERVLGKKARLIIENSLDKGVYCEIHDAEIDKDVLVKIEEEMKKITESEYIFTKINVSRLEAIKFFKKKKREDKVKVLKYISNTYVNLYRLDEYYDYFYGEMPYDTSLIDEFKVTHIKDNGFVVSYPDINNPELTLDYIHHPMLHKTFLDYTKWGKVLDVANAADLNGIVSTGKYDDLIRLSEAYYNSQLSRIADTISDDKNVKIVLMAGPSSSGKTTTSKKLEVYLKSHGKRTHQISLDDYYVNRVNTPRDENGDYDYESIKSIDVNLFNKHLSRLLAGEEVLLPEYNFITGEREYKKKNLKIGNEDIVIIEGLHGLNEDLTASIERKNKFKIYISPLTQLNIDDHNRIHTTDTRKLRRIVRDNKYRNYNASDTLTMWHKIRRGEEKYIYPYQDDADVIVNSALIYELGILKTYAEPLLFSVSENDPVYPEALRLINFLRNFLPIPSDNVPNDSILREFIGGSCFE